MLDDTLTLILKDTGGEEVRVHRVRARAKPCICRAPGHPPPHRPLLIHPPQALLALASTVFRDALETEPDVARIEVGRAQA